MTYDLRVFSYRTPSSVGLGLSQLRREGLTPRGLSFLALDALGASHIAILSDAEQITTIRVGEKLAVGQPWPTEPTQVGQVSRRLFHYDAIHRLAPGGVLWNGDRRLSHPGSATEVAIQIAVWLKGYNAKNVFLGCTPHQPGSWWAASDRTPAVALHERGFVDVVTTPTGLLARRMGEPNLYFRSYTGFAEAPLEDWVPIFGAPLGNLLLLERRVLGDRLVMTCEHGLVEVDVGQLPNVTLTAKVELKSGFGVVGRIDGGAFAVTVGKVQPWGLDNVAPALLVGAEGTTLMELARSLAAKPAASNPEPGSDPEAGPGPAQS